MAISSSHMRFTFECRSDPDFSPPPSFDNLHSRNFGASSKTGIVFHSVSSLILRFPSNFQRQLSTKARCNCNNIGVAQIVAASWSNNIAKSSHKSNASKTIHVVMALELNSSVKSGLKSMR
ncbi:hypothetical protein Fmac_004978 [Flemingia macrophylla]|uniref:Uncharacterized protein n=1 Tax=Flemingia macrophylla TaxID=520843 RepID=A0ABD1N6F1_9FABA